MNWDKVREWAATLLLPVAVAVAGYLVANSNAKREVDARMIEIAAQVLAGPANDSTRAVREWAAKELARHSDVPFPAEAESILVRVGPNIFALVARRQFGGLLLCDSAGNHCRPMFEKPLPMPVGVQVQPQTATLLGGDSMQFSGAIKMSDGSAPPSVSWTVTGGGRINANGVFTADTIPGDFLVTAHAGGAASATARVHIVRAHGGPVRTATVEPSHATLTIGSTAQLVVTLRDSSGNTLMGRTVTWASSNAAVASVSRAGLVTAGKVGTANITATSEGRSGSASVIVQ